MVFIICCRDYHILQVPMVVGGTIQNREDLKDIFSKVEEELLNNKWNSCFPSIIIPGCGLPENSKPEATPTPEDNIETTFAEQVVKLVNLERRKAGLSELTLDKTIAEAALTRAKEITQSFSHTRPNGSNFSTVLKEHGITYKGAGENIAWGQTSPEAVMKAWMNSEGHRTNILNGKFTKIGVGHYRASNGRDYWAQLFTY